MVEPNQSSIINRTTKDQFKFFFDEIPSRNLFLRGSFPGDLNQIDDLPSVKVKKANLPEVTCDENRQKTPYGEVTDFSNIVVYNDLALTCIIDENLMVYNMIMLWVLMKKFPGVYGSIVPEYNHKEDIFVDGHLDIINNHGEVTTSYTFFDLHPLDIPDMDLDYASDETLTVDLNFAYSHYIPDRIRKVYTEEARDV